ncbi:MAG: hypothetical protein HQL28_03360, partial [Candidatus Omnitrophica bacterium]|nr:hypothetical protein [Candidatus Omnitrophota bacterium]
LADEGRIYGFDYYRTSMGRQALKEQMAALLWAYAESKYKNIRIMFPLVKTPDDIKYLQGVYEEILADAASGTLKFGGYKGTPTGMAAELESAWKTISKGIMFEDVELLVKGASELEEYTDAVTGQKRTRSKWHGLMHQTEPSKPEYDMENIKGILNNPYFNIIFISYGTNDLIPSVQGVQRAVVKDKHYDKNILDIFDKVAELASSPEMLKTRLMTMAKRDDKYLGAAEIRNIKEALATVRIATETARNSYVADLMSLLSAEEKRVLAAMIKEADISFSICGRVAMKDITTFFRILTFKKHGVALVPGMPAGFISRAKTFFAYTDANRLAQDMGNWKELSNTQISNKVQAKIDVVVDRMQRNSLYKSLIIARVDGQAAHRKKVPWLERVFGFGHVHNIMLPEVFAVAIAIAIGLTIVLNLLSPASAGLLISSKELAFVLNMLILTAFTAGLAALYGKNVWNMLNPQMVPVRVSAAGPARHAASVPAVAPSGNVSSREFARLMSKEAGAEKLAASTGSSRTGDLRRVRGESPAAVTAPKQAIVKEEKGLIVVGVCGMTQEQAAEFNRINKLAAWKVVALNGSTEENLDLLRAEGLKYDAVATPMVDVSGLTQKELGKAIYKVVLAANSSALPEELKGISPNSPKLRDLVPDNIRVNVAAQIAIQDMLHKSLGVTLSKRLADLSAYEYQLDRTWDAKRITNVQGKPGLTSEIQKIEPVVTAFETSNLAELKLIVKAHQEAKAAFGKGEKEYPVKLAVVVNVPEVDTTDKLDKLLVSMGIDKTAFDGITIRGEKTDTLLGIVQGMKLGVVPARIGLCYATGAEVDDVTAKSGALVFQMAQNAVVAQGYMPMVAVFAADGNPDKAKLMLSGIDGLTRDQVTGIYSITPIRPINFNELTKEMKRYQEVLIRA